MEPRHPLRLEAPGFNLASSAGGTSLSAVSSRFLQQQPVPGGVLFHRHWVRVSRLGRIRREDLPNGRRGRRNRGAIRLGVGVTVLDIVFPELILKGPFLPFAQLPPRGQTTSTPCALVVPQGPSRIWMVLDPVGRVHGINSSLRG